MERHLSRHPRALDVIYAVTQNSEIHLAKQHTHNRNNPRLIQHSLVFLLSKSISPPLILRPNKACSRCQKMAQVAFP